MYNFLLSLSYPSLRFYSDFINLHPDGIIITHNKDIKKLCISENIKYEYIPLPKISNNKFFRLLFKPIVYQFYIIRNKSLLRKKYGDNNNIYVTVLGMNDFLLPTILRSRNTIIYCNDSLNHVSHSITTKRIIDYFHLLYLYLVTGIWFNFFTDGTVKKFFWLNSHNYIEINPFKYNYDYFLNKKKYSGDILFIGGYDSAIIREKADWDSFVLLIKEMKSIFKGKNIYYKPHPNFTKDELYDLFSDVNIIDSHYPVEIIESGFNILITFITTSIVNKNKLISVAKIINADQGTIAINEHYNIRMPNTKIEFYQIIESKFL